MSTLFILCVWLPLKSCGAPMPADQCFTQAREYQLKGKRAECTPTGGWPPVGR